MIPNAPTRLAAQSEADVRVYEVRTKVPRKAPVWRACMFLRLLQPNAERRHVGLQWYEQKQTRCMNIEQHLRRPARGGRLGQARKRCTVKSADGLQTGTLCNVYGSTSNRGEFWQPGRTTPVKSLLRRREKGLKRGNQSARLSVCARHSSWCVSGLPPLVLQHSGMTLDLFQKVTMFPCIHLVKRLKTVFSKQKAKLEMIGQTSVSHIKVY